MRNLKEWINKQKGHMDRHRKVYMFDTYNRLDKIHKYIT